jgi:hypothetical protein
MSGKRTAGKRMKGDPVKRETRHRAANEPPPAPITQDDGPGEIVARPDGLHWIAPDGRQEFGPFETLERAQAYRDEFDEGAPGSDETVQEAESELGIADWIDPETGEPAEGHCPPHLHEE